MCEHLKKELDQLIPNQSIHADPVAYIDQLRGGEVANDLEVQRTKMLSKLKWYALPKLYADVLIYRFVHNWSFADIASKLDIPNRETAFYIYKKSLAMLRERKYQ